MSRLSPQRVLLALAAPALAIGFAVLVMVAVLALAGDPIGTTFDVLTSYGRTPRAIALILNNATTYYLAAMAVAIAFRMNLFNIGVDGQYRLAAFSAAAVGGAWALPAGLHQAVMILVAMAVGAAWAGIAGLLKVTRGVSEVISTIMLNAIATALVAYLLRQVAVGVAGSNNIGTRPIAESGRVPGIALVPGSPLKVFGLIVLSVAVGIAFHLVINRTRFGFELRATGQSETAAVASGVSVKRMVLYAMLLSGAVAGLVGMPQLLGASYSYALDFPAGLGFTGIAIALLGRNHAVGIAFAALFWAYLDVASNRLGINNVSPEIVTILQGTALIAVVIAYEVVRRYRVVLEQRRVGRELGTADAAPKLEGAPA